MAASPPVSSLGGTAIRSPDPASFRPLMDFITKVFDDIETQNKTLKERVDNVPGLRLICVDSDHIWREIRRLPSEDPPRLQRVWNYVEKFGEILRDIHRAISRNPNLTSKEIKDFTDIMNDILTGVRPNGNGMVRNHSPPDSSVNFSVVRGAQHVSMDGVQCTINHSNVPPELVHSLEKWFRHIQFTMFAAVFL